MASKTKAPSRLEGIPPATVRGAIELLASELAANRYLALAATHVALGFYALPKKTIEGPKTSKKLGGLHYASRGLSDFLRYAAKVLDWPELDGLASLAKYDTLRRIVLREYRPHPDSDKEKKSYFLFLAIILLYVMELTVSSEEFSRSIPLKEFELFDAEDYFDRLFSTNPDARPPVYLFPKPTIAVSSLIEVLRVELGIENPVDFGNRRSL